MRHVRQLRNRRGALEGLPLYLIILIVVAAIVVAILVGWLSTLQHPAINSVTFNVGNTAGNPGGQSLIQAAYPTCNSAAGGDTACFVVQSDGSCTFTVNAHSGAALDVTIADKGGHPLSGVQVTLASSVTFVAQPSLTLTTGGNGAPTGDAIWTSISGTLPPNQNTGTITISASYSSGGITTTGSQQITISPPSSNTQTGNPVSC